MTTNGMHPDNAKATALTAAVEQARRSLRLETFEERKIDRLDFWPMHVVTLRDAVTAAFEAEFATKTASK